MFIYKFKIKTSKRLKSYVILPTRDKINIDRVNRCIKIRVTFSWLKSGNYALNKQIKYVTLNYLIQTHFVKSINFKVIFEFNVFTHTFIIKLYSKSEYKNVKIQFMKKKTKKIISI